MIRALLLALCLIGTAQAAERTIPGPYEITIQYAGKDYDQVERTHRRLGSPYESREECRNAITRVNGDGQGRAACLHCRRTIQGAMMPDTLPTTLSPIERKATADRLWTIIARIDAGASMSSVREMVKHTATEIEPFLAEYSKDRPMNAYEDAT